MRGVIVVAALSLSVAGCSSLSLDSFKPTPPSVTVQLDSVPPGADAVTSLGPSCKTPCSVAVPATGNFTVTYTLNKFETATVPVQVTVLPGDFTSSPSTTVDPNPVVAELQSLVPAKKAKPIRKKKPKAKPAAAAAPDGSPFPDPAAQAR
uniref:PEGA domain-containing protein n=1 Tax=Rhodopseudomonas palustris (strain BisA53) TaxID=316055 RepID=Q07Q55_RHOP5